MAINKIKLPDNTTQDINDSRLLTGTGEFEINCNGTGIARIADANGALGALPGCADGTEDYTLASLDDISGFLPLSGGTMTGPIRLNVGKYIVYNGTSASIIAVDPTMEELHIGDYDDAREFSNVYIHTEGNIIHETGGSNAIVLTTNNYKSNYNLRPITISTSEPTSSQGSNGDIWIVI